MSKYQQALNNLKSAEFDPTTNLLIQPYELAKSKHKFDLEVLQELIDNYNLLMGKREN